jgi:hypothetical protein
MEKPVFLYKYRGIHNKKNLIEDHSIDALFNCYSTFSSRRNFNDLFDTKIAFKYPSPKEFKNIINRLSKSDRKFMSKYINRGKYTSDGKLFLDDFKNGMNRIIDAYAIFSLTSKNDCNLMWTHYADSHNGFCIEFKSDRILVDKIIYQPEIAKMEVSDFLLNHFQLGPKDIIGQRIKDALIKKLKEWEYEDEYRLIAAESLAKIKPEEKFTKVDYPENFVNSIIFGVRMKKEIKQFIRDNIPFEIEFKQAIEGKSRIKVQAFNPKVHL